MTILIIGAEGNIGSYLCKYFSKEHTVFPLYKAKLDIRNKAKCSDIIKEINPNIVIHSAGMTNVNLCERDETSAYQINAVGSLNIAYSCNLLNIPLVYVSCNNVYEGDKKSFYYETDECTPVNVYGKTKLAGEKLIRTLCLKYFIIRTSWIYGGKNCFVKNIINSKDDYIFTSYDEISTPTYIKDFALSIEKIIKSDIYGIYNVVNSGAVKKSFWIKTILDYANLNKEIIEMPENFISNKALHPKCTILNTSLIKSCFNIELPAWEVSLKQYIKEI